MIHEFPEMSTLGSLLISPNDENSCLAFVEMLSAEANVNGIGILRNNLKNKIDQVLREDELLTYKQ